MEEVANRIKEIVGRETPVLYSYTEEMVSLLRNAQGRTVKEILGHLIDSASNNHQRMVRLHYNDTLSFPDYTDANDLWIAVQRYNEAPWKEVVGLWEYYNLHLARIIGGFDQSKLGNLWHDSQGRAISLGEMAGSYLWHLELHLGEIHSLILSAKI